MQIIQEKIFSIEFKKRLILERLLLLCIFQNIYPKYSNLAEFQNYVILEKSLETTSQSDSGSKILLTDWLFRPFHPMVIH